MATFVSATVVQGGSGRVLMPCAMCNTSVLVHTCVYSACVQFSCVYCTGNVWPIIMLWVMVIGSGMCTNTIMNNE